MQKRPAEDEWPGPVIVVYNTDDWPQCKQKEQLERWNPGNGAAGILFQRPDLVILLETAHT